MVAVMIAGIVLTLASQPSEFWIRPSTAIRGDGLGIHNPTNHSFEFGRGWFAYLACSAVYVAVSFLFVSVLPRWIALVLLFTVILGHVYAGTNWFAIRWHSGMLASSIYGLGLGFPLAIEMGRVAFTGQELKRRLGWIAVAALLIDMSFTLLGQPASYWLHPGTAHEGNVVSRYFLVRGWWSFAAYDIVYALGLFITIGALPRLASLTVAFYFLFVSFNGASNWLYFVWRQGMEAVLAYACLLSVALVVVAFEPRRPKTAPIMSAPAG